MGPRIRIAGTFTIQRVQGRALQHRVAMPVGLEVLCVAEHRGNREGHHGDVRQQRPPEVDERGREGEEKRCATTDRDVEQPSAEEVYEPDRRQRKRDRNQSPGDVGNTHRSPYQRREDVQQWEFESGVAIRPAQLTCGKNGLIGNSVHRRAMSASVTWRQLWASTSGMSMRYQRKAKASAKVAHRNGSNRVRSAESAAGEA